MCGIAGLVTNTANYNGLENNVQSMIQAQIHRGPDGQGLHVVSDSDPVAIIGHCRLAIIDPGPSGNQPMTDPETGNWITFNGEIYNFKELKQELKKLGFLFNTQCDTEVLLKAYTAWGPDCVNHLRGIFSFCIWEARLSRLFLARDHLGVKPLYFWSDDDTFLFASEVRALLASGFIPAIGDAKGIRSFLAYGSVQDPLTLVKGIKSLLPAHTMIWQNNNISQNRYWKLPEPENIFLPSVDTIDCVRDSLNEALRLQLISDVPLGSFLSGGIDSTAIVAMMKSNSHHKPKTFSIIFSNEQYDERKYSRNAAEKIGTYHNELILDVSNVVENLEECLAAYDQPSVDGMNTYYVSKMVHDAGLTVALSGVGGDELFGGYEGYQKTLLFGRWGNHLKKTHGLSHKILHSLSSSISSSERARKISGLLESEFDPYFTSRQILNNMQVKKILREEYIKSSEGWESERFKQLESETGRYDLVNKASALELQTYMLSTLLRDTDQMSMVHALEVRVPLIDHQLVELLFKLPGYCKIDKYQPKPLLTWPLKEYIPEENVFRVKQGFELPFNEWLKKNLQQRVKSVFMAQGENSPLIVDGLEDALNQFNRDKLHWSRIWALFVLCDWLKRHEVVFPATLMNTD